MDKSVYGEIERLRQMGISALRERYREAFGEESTSAHKQHLVRRIAWRLQVLAEGDLSERARHRALEIARDADLKTRVPQGWVGLGSQTEATRTKRREPRLPRAGTVLTREYRGRRVVVKVLAEGFEYEGQQFGSLSAVARTATGTRWNGLLFFGLTQRRREKPRVQ